MNLCFVIGFIYCIKNDCFAKAFKDLGLRDCDIFHAEAG